MIHSFLFRIASLTAVVGLSLFQSAPARACGGCFHAATDQATSFVTDHRMVLSISKTQTALWDQVRYTGDPAEFAWVLPVGVGASVELARDEWINALDQATKVSVKGPDVSCGRIGSGSAVGCGTRSDSAPAYGSRNESSGADSDGGFANGQGVVVVGQAVVGPYQSVVIRANRGEAISLWLKDNGFVIPDAILPTLVSYTRAGFDFLALKLRPGIGVRAMRPVRVVSPGASFALPLRMVAAGIGAKVGLSLFVISEGRVQAQNFPNATIDPKKLTWDPEATRSNYRELAQASLAAEGGRTWLTESAVAPGTEDVSVYPGSPRAIASQVVQAQGLYQNSCKGVPPKAVPCASDAGLGSALDAQAPAPAPANDAEAPSLEDASVDDSGDTSSALDAGRSTEPARDAGLVKPPPFCLESACTGFDDDTVALRGLNRKDIWVTRLRAELSGAICSSADLQLEAAPQTTVPSALRTDTFSDPTFDPCAGIAGPDDNSNTCGCLQGPRGGPPSLALALGCGGVLFVMRRTRRRQRA
jgi:hypothetical protein